MILGSALEDTTDEINEGATTEQFRLYLKQMLHEIWKIQEEQADKDMQSLEEMYLKSDPFRGAKLGRSEAYWAARRLKADADMTCVARRAARAYKQATGAPAYWYVWATADPNSEFRPAPGAATSQKLALGECWPCAGAGHGADLPFVFDTGDVHVEDAKADLADVVQALYRNFVITGDPNSWNGFTISRNGREAWPEADAGGMQFEAGDIRFDADLRGDACDYWDAHPAP